jgi:hypothetical protein
LILSVFLKEHFFSVFPNTKERTGKRRKTEEAQSQQKDDTVIGFVSGQQGQDSKGHQEIAKDTKTARTGQQGSKPVRGNSKQDSKPVRACFSLFCAAVLQIQNRIHINEEREKT